MRISDWSSDVCSSDLYRIHGELYLMNEKPAEDGKLILGTLYGSMCDVAATTYQSSLDQDARVKTEYVERCGLYSARVSSGPTDKGTVMVLRLLYDTNKSVKTLAQLGYLQIGRASCRERVCQYV